MKSIKDLKQENEMASTMKAAAIEEMRAELEQAGYEGEWYASWGGHQDYTFVFDDGLQVSDSDKDKAIKLAYRHLKQSQFLARLAELREAYQNKPEDAALGNIEQDIVNLVLGYKDE